MLEACCRSPVTLQRDLKRARIVLLAAAWRRRAPLIEFLAPMRSIADYRAYTFGLDGRLIGFEPLVCADDAEAIGLSSLSVTGRLSFGTGHASLKLGSNKICRPPPSPLG